MKHRTRLDPDTLALLKRGGMTVEAFRQHLEGKLNAEVLAMLQADIDGQIERLLYGTGGPEPLGLINATGATP